MRSKKGKAEQLKSAVERLFRVQAAGAPTRTMLSIAYSTDQHS